MYSTYLPPDTYDETRQNFQRSGSKIPAYQQFVSTSVQNGKGDSVSFGGSPRPTNWEVGWTAPLTIVVAFGIAVAIAVAHYLYCQFLNNKFVESTIPQSWNNAISVAFAHAFSTALAASASTAYTQLLWWYLRRRDIPLAKIDTLFQLNSSPFQLRHLGILRFIPILWIFGLLIPLISVATVFPPGSVIVQQLPDPQQIQMRVPTLDVGYHGNGSANDFFTNAMFVHGPDGDYRGPNVRYSRIGKRTMLEGSYLTRSSPCGPNCTYSLEFAGPSLRCEDGSPNTDLESEVFALYSNKSQEEGTYGAYWTEIDDANFMAAPYSSEDQFKFDLSYRDGSTYENAVRQNLETISCTTWDANYTANIRYENSVQTVTVNVIDVKPLNATLLGQTALFVDIFNTWPTSDGFEFAGHRERGSKNLTVNELFEVFRWTQMRTIRDSMIRPLSGAVSDFGGEVQFIMNTLVLETNLASQVFNETVALFTGISFNLTPNIVEELMRNVTISTFNDAGHFVDTMVETTIYRSAYVFNDRLRLIGAYAVALAVCLVFVLLGFGALIQNGTPASSGGIYQILCTTTYKSGVMNQLAREAGMKSTESVPKDLAKLKVKFGIVNDGGRRYPAFGTADEIQTLEKES